MSMAIFVFTNGCLLIIGTANFIAIIINLCNLFAFVQSTAGYGIRGVDFFKDISDNTGFGSVRPNYIFVLSPFALDSFALKVGLGLN